MQVSFLYFLYIPFNFISLIDISTLYNHQQQPPPSNPWNMPGSSSMFPPATKSISPPNSGLTTGGNMLYPTIAGSTNNSNSNNPSPIPSAASRKTPESFLGENFGNLVNFDKLVTDPKSKRILKIISSNFLSYFLSYKSIWFNSSTCSKSICKYNQTTNT